MSDTRKTAHEFLKANPMAIISTASSEGEPWGSAVYYYVDEDLNFYFITRANTKKYDNIQQNMQAAITIADQATQTTVQASGTISLVPAEEYMSVLFDKFEEIKKVNDKYWAPPIEKIHEGNYIPLKLTPTKLQYANYSEKKSDPRASYIHKII